MGEKSKQGHSEKKPATKSIKEKRLDKKAKAGGSHDIIPTTKKT